MFYLMNMLKLNYKKRKLRYIMNLNDIISFKKIKKINTK